MGQLALQSRLIDEGNPVRAKDVMALAGALARVLEKNGLERMGTPGERVAFDPVLHRSTGGAVLLEGTDVTVRGPGYRLGGKVLCKAMVQKE